jgi:transcription elongation factor Elf1
MNERHRANEQLKRLEPTDPSCIFCGKASSTSMEDNHFQTIFSVTGSTDVIIFSSIKYKKVDVGVARCKNCTAVHEKMFQKGAYICMALSVPFIVAGAVIDGLFGGLVGLVVAAFILSRCFPFLERYLIHQKGVLTKKEGAKKEPTIKALLQSGWSFKEP